MADNLDPEIQRQLNEQMQKMTDTVSSMVPAMVLMTAAMSEYIAESKGLTGVQKDGKKVVEDFLKAQKDATAAAEAEAKAAKELEKAMNLLKKSYDSALEGLGKFTKALFTVGGGMDKYSGALDSAGDAAWNAGKAFGPLGMVIGGIVKAFSFMATAVFKQNDAMLKASDDLAQMGVTGGITSKEIMTLGQRAGYSSGQLEDWTNIVKGLGPDIIALGLSATEGTKAFGKLTEMDEQVLEGYRNLGVSQTALNKNQADYIKLQVRSGQEIDKRLLQDGSLRKASLEYTNNLLELSAFSGMEVEEIKKRQEVERADLAFSTRMALLQDKEMALREKAQATGDKDLLAQAEKVKTEITNTKALQDMAINMKMSGDEMAAVNSMLATGNFNELSAGFAAGVPGILEFFKSVKEGTRQPYEFAKVMADATKQTRTNVGEAIIQQKDIGKSFAYSKEMVENAARFEGKTADEIAEMRKQEQAKRDAALRGEIDDDAKRARNAQETTERRARLGADAIVGVLNGPVTKAFESLMKVMGALAKGIAHFAKWLGGPDFTEMFDTPEEVATKVKDNAKVLEETTRKIEETKKLMSDPKATKEELVKQKQAAEDIYMAKAQETEKIRDLYSKEGDEKKKAILKDQLLEARKEEQAAKQAADTASLAIKNTSFSLSETEGKRRILELEKQRATLLEKEKTLTERQQTMTGGAPAAVATSATGTGRPAEPFKGDSKEFYNKMYQTLLEEAKKAKVANPEAVARLGASQSSLETGYGKSTAGGNNYFGIKGGGNSVETQEWDPKLGKMVTIKDSFRKYNSMEESAADYIKFLQENKRYKDVLAAKSAEEAIAAQGRTGYATDPDYAKKLAAINARGQPTTPQGADGLSLDGPLSGYPVTAHGRETLIPDFKIPDLVEAVNATKATPLGDFNSSVAQQTSSDSGLGMMVEMLAEKLDDMIDKLSSSNDIQDQLLRVSRV